MSGEIIADDPANMVDHGHHHRGFSLVDEEPGGGAEELEGTVNA